MKTENERALKQKTKHTNLMKNLNLWIFPIIAQNDNT